MPDNNNLSTIKNVYFIGIGGVSMSSLALILKSLGKSVSGVVRISAFVLNDAKTV